MSETVTKLSDEDIETTWTSSDVDPNGGDGDDADGTDGDDADGTDGADGDDADGADA